MLISRVGLGELSYLARVSTLSSVLSSFIEYSAG